MEQLFELIALTTLGFVEIGYVRGTAGANRYGANPLKPRSTMAALVTPPITPSLERKKARRPLGHRAN